jgi:hypothetical protein
LRIHNSIFHLAKGKSIVLDSPAIFSSHLFSQTASEGSREARGIGKRNPNAVIRSAGLPDTRIVKPYLAQPKAK